MMTKKTPIHELEEIPGYSSWLEVVKTYTKCQRLLTNRLGALDLSIARYEVLLAIMREEGLSQKRLAERLLVAKSNITVLLQRLEERGLVERHADPDDARGHCVTLTKAGRSLVRKGSRAQGEVVHLMMDGVSPADARSFERITRTVGARLDAAIEAEVARGPRQP